MFLVLMAICIIIFFIGLMMFGWRNNDDIGGALCITGICGGVVCLIAIIMLGVNVSKLAVIDDKIAMYQEENQKIEMQIAETVERYQDYESDMFGEVNPENSIALVTLYPELKSDTLVQKQIEVYIENNNIIKSLKSQQISGNVTRWWLYFGGRKGAE